jgi:hypothetical protein
MTATILTLIGTLVGTVVGAGIVFAGSYIATSRAAKAQQLLQDRQFARDDAAVREILFALLMDVYQYVDAAARYAQFDKEKWRQPVDRLLDFVQKIEVGHALTRPEIKAVLAAAFEASLTLNRLANDVSHTQPFEKAFVEKYPEVNLDEAEFRFVMTIRNHSRECFVAFNRALEAIGYAEHIDRSAKPSVVDVRNAFRTLIGRPLVKPPGNSDDL